MSELVVGYVRVSTDDQRLGADAQRAAIEGWCAGNACTVHVWAEDIGVSGAAALEDRPGLMSAITACRSVRPSMRLVVAKRDRLARDLLVVRTVERLVSVVSAAGEGNGDTPADAFMRTILDAAAEYERGLIRARTKSALAERRRAGRRVGTVPFGYRALNDGTVVICEEEQAVRAVVRHLHTSGYGLRRISAYLASRGVVNRVGKRYGVSSVYRMLRVDAGHVQPLDEGITSGDH